MPEYVFDLRSKEYVNLVCLSVIPSPMLSKSRTNDLIIQKPGRVKNQKQKHGPFASPCGQTSWS